MTIIRRTPSVADYERMTQAARLSAARLVEDRIAALEAARADVLNARRREAEAIGGVVMTRARAILKTLEPYPPHITAARRDVLDQHMGDYRSGHGAA